MKGSKSYKYKNYGPIPHNEYTTANPGENTNAATVLGDDPQAGDTAYKHRLIKRQAQHPSGRRKIRGWSRSWKANGWRAESASQDVEFTGVERDSSYA